MYKNWQKMMGTNYWKWIIQANVAAGKLKKVGGRETNYCKCPQGARTRENGRGGGHAMRGI